jgi:hypothetical protein
MVRSMLQSYLFSVQYFLFFQKINKNSASPRRFGEKSNHPKNQQKTNHQNHHRSDKLHGFQGDFLDKFCA